MLLLIRSIGLWHDRKWLTSYHNPQMHDQHADTDKHQHLCTLCSCITDALCIVYFHRHWWWLVVLVFVLLSYLPHHCKALNSLIYADVPLKNYSLTHSLIYHQFMTKLSRSDSLTDSDSEAYTSGLSGPSVHPFGCVKFSTLCRINLQRSADASCHISALVVSAIIPTLNDAIIHVLNHHCLKAHHVN